MDIQSFQFARIQDRSVTAWLPCTLYSSSF